MVQVKKYNGLISLRISPELHQQVSKLAEKQNRSLNAYISLILEEAVNFSKPTSDSFEKRQFIGKTISTNKINSKNGLVDMDGIYYRYLIDGNRNFSNNKNYVVIESNGNILTLRELEK